jgi:hypothetical protein
LAACAAAMTFWPSAPGNCSLRSVELGARSHAGTQRAGGVSPGRPSQLAQRGATGEPRAAFGISAVSHDTVTFSQVRSPHGEPDASAPRGSASPDGPLVPVSPLRRARARRRPGTVPGMA